MRFTSARNVSAGSDNLQSPLQRLLAGVRQSAVVVDRNAAKAFSAAFAELENRLQKSGDADEVTSAAIALLKDYGRQANQSVGRQQAELARLVGELTSAMRSLPEVQDVANPILALENEFAAVTSLEELPSFRSRLREALDQTRARMIGIKQGISDLISSSLAKMRRADSLGGATQASATDELTGLPNRTSAEAELARVHAQFPNCRAALFVVRRLQLINSKFGFSRGDQVLMKVVQHLAQEMPEYTNIFRWTSCSFLVLESPAATTDLRSQVQLISLQRLTMMLEWEGHSALVPIALDSKVFSLRDYISAEALHQALDATVLN